MNDLRKIEILKLMRKDLEYKKANHFIASMCDSLRRFYFSNQINLIEYNSMLSLIHESMLNKRTVFGYARDSDDYISIKVKTITDNIKYYWMFKINDFASRFKWIDKQIMSLS
jgi:hypothetical protein